MIRFLCKSNVGNEDSPVVTKGDIAYVDFGYEYAHIAFIKSNGEKKDVDLDMNSKDFFNHFVKYDDTETINAFDTMKYYIFQYSRYKVKDKSMVFKLKNYTNKRLIFLHQCATEDTQSEQSSTETLHTINQQ